MPVEEVAPVELVHGEGVEDELGVLLDAVEDGAGEGGALGHVVQRGSPDGLPALGQLAPHTDSGDDVRALFGGDGEQSVDGPGQQQVVAVEEEDVGVHGGAHAVVAGCAAASAVLRPDQRPDPRLVGEPGEHLGRRVPGGVVDDEDLTDRLALGERGTDGVADVRRVVVRDDDDTDTRGGLRPGGLTHP